MAEVKFSGVGVVDMNGSVGNMTFARNFYGAYAKTRIGAPASTPFLVAWQTEVASLVNVWEFGLSEADRKVWYTVAQEKKDSMADTNKITGFDLYMSINLNLFLVSSAPVTAPPVSFERLQIPEIIIGAHTTVAFRISAAIVGSVPCALYFSRNLSPGRMSNNQIYAYAGLFGISAVPINVAAQFNTRIGALVSGKKVFVKLVPISQTSGLRGVPQYASAIIS